MTNASGTVTDTYNYDAFGNKLNSTGTTPNNYLYRGEQYDPDLGLYYLRARYYNPMTGRFLSRDPEDGRTIDPDTLHKYLYSGGDPINGIDPTGRSLVDSVILRVVLVSVAIEQIAGPELVNRYGPLFCLGVDIYNAWEQIKDLFEFYESITEGKPPPDPGPGPNVPPDFFKDWCEKAFGG